MRIRMTAQRLDKVLAVVLCVAAQLQIFVGGHTGWPAVSEAVVGGLVTGSIAVRRRWPAAVGIGVQALMVGAQYLGGHAPAGAITAGWFCALYALAVWTSWPWFLAGVSFFVGSDMLPLGGDPATVRMVWNFTAGVVLVMVFLRLIVGGHERQLRIAEREREVARREAVVEERARIARELHDAIAHSVSMMVVQAGAERRVLDPSQESTREVLTTIERIGRGALTEMRRLVGMLRSDQPDELAPQPSLADVPELVAGLRAAGLPVELQVDGERRELPVGIELSAYRVVQEGLTNALKHAGGSRVLVAIAYGPRSLELRISDDGVGAPVNVPSGGHGLVGIRERVSLYGGELEAGQRPEGGFVLRVLLPTR